MTAENTRILVTDFDGTITKFDFYEIVLDRFVGPSGLEYWTEYTNGRLTHFEALNGMFSRITCDEETLRSAIWDMKPDPNLAEAVGTLRAAGWDIEIVSAGCRWYIDQILATAGVSVTIHANPGRFVPGRGLVMELPVDSPYFSPSDGIDKPAVVRNALRTREVTAFAGNGPPDLAPARLVPEGLRFARGWLADALDREQLKFHRYETWSEIARKLIATSDE